jgi:hypothetical protein
MPMWFFRILKEIPALTEGYHKFVKFCCDELEWRVQNDGEKGSGANGDIMGWLLKAFTEIPHPEHDPTLQADARLIIVAGSDTTAASLTFLFYHLAQEPAQVEKIRDELRPVTTGEWSDKDIKNCAHLNGAINEALRLHPPVPSGLQRTTPKEGMHIGETFIPGNTNFWMPQYVMGRGKSFPPLLYTNPQTQKSTFTNKFPSRQPHLPPSNLLPPRALVQQTRRADQAQGRFRALLHGALWLHRQEPGLHADPHADGENSAGV